MQSCRLVIVDQTRKTIELFCGSEVVALPDDLRTKLHASLRKK